MTKRELMEQLWAMEKSDPVSKISRPSDILPVLSKYAGRKQEEFVVVTLDAQHAIIKVRSITKGLVNSCVVHAREVFRPAIKDNAVAVIVSHNHPSGNLEKSQDDDYVTHKLVEAGKVVGIPVLDHIVVSKTGYFSYLENSCLH